MTQVISIHVGGGGIRPGNSCWELFCLDHNISDQGQYIPYNQSNEKQLKEVFFQERDSKAGLRKFVPRSLHLDSGPNAVDEIKTGRFRNLFCHDQFLQSKKNSACIFPRGYQITGLQIIDAGVEKLRRMAEKCQKLSGFMIYQPISGGTGSGLGSLIYERISEQYGKKITFGLNILPQERKQSSLVQTYNSVLSIDKLLNNMNIGIIFDNQALHEICVEKFLFDNPNYKDFNRICAQMVYYLTNAMRMDGYLCNKLQQFEQLIVYQRFKFMLGTYTPMYPADRSEIDSNTTQQNTIQCFKSNFRLAKCDPKLGKYMGCFLMYQGNIVPKDVTLSTVKSDKLIQFVDWSPTGVKVGINYHPIKIPQSDIFKPIRSTCMISNTTAIQKVFSRIGNKFDKIFKKKAFIHWYQKEGMEQLQFADARENMLALQKDYQQANFQIEDDEGVEEG